MTVTAQYAAEHFNELSAAVDQGHTVEITRDNKLALKLISVGSGLLEPAAKAPRRLGAGIGDLRPITKEEWDDLEQDWQENVMNKTRFVRDSE